MMQLHWTKSDGQGKPDTLTCLRSDGTTTYTPLSPFFPLHDLLHYAVETAFGFENAFWGLIASGWSIDDFHEKDQVTGKIARSVPAEAMIAENIVCFLTSVETGSLPADPEAIYELFRQYLQGIDCPVPSNLTPEAFAEARARFALLKARWQDVPTGGTLELTYL